MTALLQAPAPLMRIGVIVNPRSKKNLTRPDRWQSLQEIIRGTGEVRVTRSLDELSRTAADFVEHRCAYVVADGGDGTLHWVVNKVREALEAARGRPSRPGDHPEYPVIIPSNGGTIDCVARRVGIKGHADGILKVLNGAVREGRTLPIEPVETLFVEGVRVVDGVEQPFRRIGFAAAVAGAAQRFFREYYRVPVRGPGRIAGLIGRIAGSIVIRSPVLSWLRFFPPEYYRYADEFVRPRNARVVVDGTELPRHRFNVLNVGAFPINLGGVVRTFRCARDGRLHVHAGQLSRLELIVQLPRILLGRRVGSPRLYDGPARALRVLAQGDDLLEPAFDGEMFPGVREIVITPGPRIPMARIVCTGS